MSDVVASLRLFNLYQEKQKFSLTLCYSSCVQQSCFSAILHQFPFLSQVFTLSPPYKSFLSCFIVLNISHGNFDKERYHSLFAFYRLSFRHRIIKMLVHHIFAVHHPCVQHSNDIPLLIVFYCSPGNVPTTYHCISYFIVHHPYMRRSNGVPSTTDQCGARSG